MNFIVENYIFFLISGFILLMITIGYYADKTKFGRKLLNEKSLDDDISKPDVIDIIDDSDNDLLKKQETINNIPSVFDNSVAIPDSDQNLDKSNGDIWKF